MGSYNGQNRCTKTLRILLQNPNGISADWSNLEFQYSLTKCHSLGIGVITMAETKTNWTNTVKANANSGSTKSGTFPHSPLLRQMKASPALTKPVVPSQQ
jgi:hypothetical protein